MDRKQALTELLERVEAGERPDTHAARAFPPENPSGHCTFHDVVRAFNGSLDAAKALHEAVLPEWPWSVKTLATDAVQVWTDKAYGLRRPGFIGTTADAPGRAWLIAVLTALIAQEDE